MPVLSRKTERLANVHESALTLMFQDPVSIVGIFKCESLQIAKSTLENTLGEEVVLL